MTNILMIDCHDLGQHLGSYGQTSVSSRHLDQLAQAGIRFENSFGTAPQCSPSRAALYTGRYAESNGMFGLSHHPFNWRMHDDEVYLARYLQDAGYETAHVGIQHVTESSDEAVKALGFDHVLQGYLAPDVAASAIRFLEESSDRPFFLNIGFVEPHRDRTGGFNYAPADETLGVVVPSYLPDTPEARQELSQLQGTIRHMDLAIGKILDALKSLNLTNDTWIIFTTDHGLAMPRAKCTMYDPGVKTALIMHAPSLDLVGGRVVNNLVSHVDLVPTILEGLGLPVPDSLQGESYWQFLQGKREQTREMIFAGKTFHTAYEPQRMVRTEQYKLIWNAEVNIVNVPGDIMHSPIYPQMVDTLTVKPPPFQLYDLKHDPDERINLAEVPDYAPILDDLRQHLLQWMMATGDPILEGPVASPYYADAIGQLK